METITYGKRTGRHAAEWALSNTTVTVPESAERDAQRELDELLDREEGERPWAIRDELAETMHVNFGVFRREHQMQQEGQIVVALRERYERVVVEDKGEVFNSDLTQALEPASCSTSRVHDRRPRAQGSRGRTRARDYPERDDENSSGIRSSAGSTVRRGSTGHRCG
jgi:succinate dehydrogenase / fumarate reductase flavoprotein subunit